MITKLPFRFISQKKKKQMHNLFRYFWISLFPFFLMSLLFSSCKKDVAPDVGYNYYPDRVGKFVIYEVDSISKDDLLGVNDTFKMQLKEIIQSVYNDNQGRPTMRIERYKKFYNPSVSFYSMPWTLKDVWSATRTNTTLETNEENITYTRMIFPVRENKNWDGNAPNIFEIWDYEYTSVDAAETINSIAFDSVATVMEINSSNLVETKYSEAKYAKNVGLVYRRLILLGKQPINVFDTPPYDDTLGLVAYISYSNKAIIYTQQVIAFGN